MTSQPDVRRIARRAAFLAEARLLPLDARVGIGAVLEQLPRQLKRRDVAGLLRRPCGVLPTPAAPSAPGLRSHATVWSGDPRGSGRFGLAPCSSSIDASSK